MCNIFKPKEIEYQPTSNVVASMLRVLEILQKVANVGQIYLSDNVYVLAHPDDIAWFLANDETNKMGYVSEERDCDDFAYRLMGQFSIPEWSGLTFGIVWTDVHALNCFIDENENFLFIEPQTDEVFTELKPSMGTKIRFIIM